MMPGEDADVDPFSEANRARPAGLPDQRASALVERADRAYDLKRYETAAQLYGQAHRLAPASVANCQAQWAYCRLRAVLEAVNRGAVEQRADLEREVRAALATAPQLERYAKKVLDRLNEPGGANVKVTHVPRQGSGWAVAQTANFKIYHATSEEMAEKVARVAEATRLAMTRKWFGEMPVDWSPACVIYLHPTGQGYAKVTGASPSAPGHSRYKQDGERVLERRIDLPADNPDMLTSTLPHETTHMVLVGRLARHCVPRWADEGMALLSEPRQRLNLHLRNLPESQRDGTLFTLRELLAQSDWPKEGRRMAAFFAQGASVVDFLCQKKDAATFVRFLREALDQGGYERALQRYYGCRGYDELEAEWKRFAFGAGAVASASDKR
jgi:hypothetical protein